MLAQRIWKLAGRRNSIVAFDMRWVSGVFFVLYLGFVVLFFWGLKHFRKALESESSQNGDENHEDS